jgi:hypothetical protein
MTARRRVPAESTIVEARARALLLACLQTPLRPQDVAMAAGNLCEAGWTHFVALAAEQRVRPLVRAALTRSDGVQVPVAIAATLAKQCRRIAVDQLVKHAELGQIVRDFAVADIPVIVLKGGCLGTLVYRDVAMREMNDLDLLVPRASLQRAVDVLVGRGYQPQRPFIVETEVAFMHHLAPFVKGPVAVEIHWNITPPGWPYTIDPADLWPRAVPMPGGDMSGLRLGLEDLLLHLCVHSSYQHQFECGLRPSCDIAALIRRYGDHIDWDAVCQRAEHWRWMKGVAVALALSHHVVGAAVPPAVLRRLGSRHTDLLAVADRLLWTTAGEASAFTAGISVFGSHAGWSRRIRNGWTRLMLSRAELAWRYAIPPDSPWLPLCYVRRLGYLLWTYTASAMRLVGRRDPDLLALAERRDRMRQWLLDS